MIKRFFAHAYCLLFRVAYRCASQEEKNKIDMDIARYDEGNLSQTLLNNRNYRNIFYYRLSKQKLIRICKILLKPNPNIEIYVKNGNIGGGLKIFHNLGCVIAAEEIGENCTILQGVTIGNGKKNEVTNKTNPVIGNNVCVHANAVIFGGITVGDNVMVGANSSVHTDIPSDVTVVGNSKIVYPKEKGNR